MLIVAVGLIVCICWLVTVATADFGHSAGGELTVMIVFCKRVLILLVV